MLRIATGVILTVLIADVAGAQVQPLRRQEPPRELRPGESFTFPDRFCSTGYRRVTANADGTRDRKCVARYSFPAEIVLGEK